MKLKTLFHRAVDIGISADPRGKTSIEKMLRKEKERQKKLEGRERELADSERTWNPYGDTRIMHGTGEEEVTHLMVGIDIETAEILLADRLRERGEKIDAILNHHPEGRALMDLDQVMSVQADVLACSGVPINVSEGHLGPRMDRIRRSIHADNLFRAERAAELIGFPSFGCHTVTDNLAYQFMEKTVCKKQYDALDEILNAILQIPEYWQYAKKGNPPIIVNGRKDGRPGKISATGFTGGTNGPEELMEAQARAGIGTVLFMHVTEKELEKAKEHHINVIQCSHMASDALGVNLLLDQLKKEEKRLTTLDVSGFVRVVRTK